MSLDLNLGGLDFGSLLGGLTGTNTSTFVSQCVEGTPDYDECKKAEDEAAAKAALEEKQRQDAQY